MVKKQELDGNSFHSKTPAHFWDMEVSGHPSIITLAQGWNTGPVESWSANTGILGKKPKCMTSCRPMLQETKEVEFFSWHSTLNISLNTF